MRESTLLLLLFFMLSVGALADRWEYIATDKDGDGYYLDTTTTERPDARVVIFWMKRYYLYYGSRLTEMQRIRMWNDRTFQRVDEPGYRTQDIPPDSIMEAFFERLFRTRSAMPRRSVPCGL